MMMRMIGLVVAGVMMMAGMAHAQSAASREALLGQANPHAAQLEKAAKDLFEDLSESEQAALTLVRTNFGIMRSIEIVHGDVKKAVEACGKANPDMKDGPQDAFKNWEGEVMKRVEKQEKAMKDALAVKNFTKPEKIKAFLQLLDKAARHAESQIEKNVLDDETHCRKLAQSLRGGQEAVVAALDGLSWPDGKPETEKTNDKTGDKTE